MQRNQDLDDAAAIDRAMQRSKKDESEPEPEPETKTVQVEVKDEPEATIPPALLNERGIVISDTRELRRFAISCDIAGMVPKSYRFDDGSANIPMVMLAISTGMVYGFSASMSLKFIYVINGMATLHTDGPIAVVLDSGKFAGIEEHYEGEFMSDGWTAVCKVGRYTSVGNNIAWTTERFSWAQAKRAGLTSKDTYMKYPDRMLKLRARAYALRTLFADHMAGIGIREEVEDYGFDARETAAYEDHQEAQTRSEQVKAKLKRVTNTAPNKESQSHGQESSDEEGPEEEDRGEEPKPKGRAKASAGKGAKAKA